MKFSTNEDIAAPIDGVFDLFTDFGAFERAALRRGAEVQRLDRLTAPGVGMTWRAQFTYRGRSRDLTLGLIDFQRPEALRFEGHSPGFAVQGGVELIALSRSRTRAHVTLNIKPQTLPARLLIQSLKLGKASLTARYKNRVANYARGLEDRHAVQLYPRPGWAG